MVHRNHCDITSKKNHIQLKNSQQRSKCSVSVSNQIQDGKPNKRKESSTVSNLQTPRKDTQWFFLHGTKK